MLFALSWDLMPTQPRTPTRARHVHGSPHRADERLHQGNARGIPAQRFLEPGAVSTTPIKAGDLTEGHVGKSVGCHDPQTGFNYGAKIVNVIRQEDGPNWKHVTAAPPAYAERETSA